MSVHFKPCFLYIPIRYFSLLLFHDKIGIQIIELIKELKEKTGSGVILITHDNGIAATAERVVRISDGHIIYDGDREGAFL